MSSLWRVAIVTVPNSGDVYGGKVAMRATVRGTGKCYREMLS